MSQRPRWDIFCKIVDNFGDIGVCWRLARHLQSEHGLQVHLWVDDLSVAQKIIPAINIGLNQQTIENITILKWDIASNFSQAADVVIEAFACELPPAYLALMAQQKSKWINLEYLSAESWVDDFHGRPSPQSFVNSANGLTRYFYFPGFTDATGGLIRDKNIVYSNQKDSSKKSRLNISLFCYPNAPIKDLLDALQANKHAVHVFIPVGSILPTVARYFSKDKVEVGDTLTKNNLTVEVLPFLSQADYDVLLSDCDINFVRGEDSWIRAIWAGKPFIWQPYLQTENTHIKKLKAFIDVFYANYEQKEILWKAHEYWAADYALQNDFKDIWHNYVSALQSIQDHTKKQTQKLAQQTDLVTKLVIFCNNI